MRKRDRDELWDALLVEGIKAASATPHRGTRYQTIFRRVAAAARLDQGEWMILLHTLCDLIAHDPRHAALLQSLPTRREIVASSTPAARHFLRAVEGLITLQGLVSAETPEIIAHRIEARAEREAKRWALLSALHDGVNVRVRPEKVSRGRDRE